MHLILVLESVAEAFSLCSRALAVGDFQDIAEGTEYERLNVFDTTKQENGPTYTA